MNARETVVQTEGLMKKGFDAVAREFGEVRTGRAHPALVEELHVDYYGTLTPLRQIANVTSPDPTCLVIQPWDPAALAGIEKAILGSRLGITPNNDGKIIRLVIPPLSEERRRDMVKMVKDMAEKGRISLRNIRREANDRVTKMKKDNLLSEDDSFKCQEEVQKLTDRYIREVDALLDKKTKELLTI